MIVIVYIKMIIDFQSFLFTFPWWPYGPDFSSGHKQITKVWKSVYSTVLVMGAVQIQTLLTHLKLKTGILLLCSYSDVDSAWAAWFDMFNKVCFKHAPIREKKIREYLPEWVTTDFLKLTKDNRHCLLWRARAIAHSNVPKMLWVGAKNHASCRKSLRVYFCQTFCIGHM